MWTGFTYGRLINRRCVWYSGTKCVRLDSPESRVTCKVSACNDSCLVYLAQCLVVHCIESQEAPQCPSSRLALRGFEHDAFLPGRPRTSLAHRWTSALTSGCTCVAQCHIWSLECPCGCSPMGLKGVCAVAAPPNTTTPLARKTGWAVVGPIACRCDRVVNRN